MCGKSHPTCVTEYLGYGEGDGGDDGGFSVAWAHPAQLGSEPV